MKENEAPEKIHVQPNAHDKWFEGKIPSGLPYGLFIEYTRTDAFIEKALKWYCLDCECNDNCKDKNAFSIENMSVILKVNQKPFRQSSLIEY